MSKEYDYEGDREIKCKHKWKKADAEGYLECKTCGLIRDVGRIKHEVEYGKVKREEEYEHGRRGLPLVTVVMTILVLCIGAYVALTVLSEVDFDAFEPTPDDSDNPDNVLPELPIKLPEVTGLMSTMLIIIVAGMIIAIALRAV